MDSLHKLIDIDKNKKELVCMVGAGGKTSVMFQLASELSAAGRRVMVTTTTAIYYPLRKQYDEILLSEVESIDLFRKTGRGVTVFGKSVSSEGKLLGATPQFLDTIFSEGIFDFILVEGDGSKGRPLKAPAGHEPVIPASATKVMGLIGMDCIGKRISSDNLHRPELFCKIAGCSEGEAVDVDMLIKLIAHKEGLFKSAPKGAGRYLILNKLDGEAEEAAARELASKLSFGSFGLSGIIISSIKNSSFRRVII